MALVEGSRYGLSSQTNLSGKKSVIFLKLTDSALRAIEEYIKIQNKTGQHATLQFLGNEGRIHIPSSHANDGHSFDFSLSSNTDIEGPQGSFECIQQSGSRSLESMGTLPFKMRIHAKDDVYEMTKERMNAVEEERKKDCAKEIKQNGADINRKGKNKYVRGLPPPRREDSPIFNNHNSHSHHNHSNHHSSKPSLHNSSSNSNHKISNGPPSQNANIKNSPNGLTKVANGGGSGGNLDVSRRPLKERLIHLLAVKSFKKPELMARIYRDGIKEKDKKLVWLILAQVSIYKDNEYNLIRGIWNDVQEDWPFYTEQERQLMKRRKPQNLTPPGSDCSVGSGTSGSSLSPRSTTSVGSGHSPVNYSGSVVGSGGTSYHRDRDGSGRERVSHVSNYSGSSQHNVPKSSSGVNGNSMPNLLLPGTGSHYNANATSQGGVKRPGSSNGGAIIDHASNGGNSGDYGDIPASKKQRVSNFKPPNCRSGGTGNSNSSTYQNGHGNGPSANARLDNNVKTESRERERDSASLSPVVAPAPTINPMTTHQSQHHQPHRNYSDRLSPIGTNNHNNVSASNSLTNNQTNGQAHSVVTNHRSPRNVVPELNLSPPYHSSSSNHSSGHNGGSSQDDYSAYPWTARNGHGGASHPHAAPTHNNLQVHNHHSQDNGFKLDVDTKLPDSDETDSVDSGNGSSSSSSSSGSTSHHHSNHSVSNASSANSVNGLSLGLPAPKVDSVSVNGETGLLNVGGSATGATNGCNRVSSTTNGSGFHTTPQSSPDSQIEALQKQQLEQQQKGSWTNGHSNGGSLTGAHHHVNGHVDRGDRERDRDKFRDREVDRDRERTRGESRREGRAKDRDRSDREPRGDKDRTDRDRKERDREREKSKEADEIERHVKSASEYPSYLTKYTTIQNGEQRSRYKEDFNAEYGEYRDLHSVIDKVSKKFAHLEERLRQEERGTEGYQNVKDQIVSEYYANKKNRRYQEAKQKFTYLHEKLSHIKRLVLDYDALHSSESGELEDGTFF